MTMVETRFRVLQRTPEPSSSFRFCTGAKTYPADSVGTDVAAAKRARKAPQDLSAQHPIIKEYRLHDMKTLLCFEEPRVGVLGSPVNCKPEPECQGE